MSAEWDMMAEKTQCDSGLNLRAIPRVPTGCWVSCGGEREEGVSLACKQLTQMWHMLHLCHRVESARCC